MLFSSLLRSGFYLCSLVLFTAVATAQAELPTAPATAQKLETVIVTAPDERIAAQPTGDTATLLANEPGVSFYGAGSASSLPVIHGMNDDRVKTVIDGAQSTAACANHMNPPLSYVAPSAVHSVEVIAGITPVSQGGDSIGGTIIVKTPPPLFAATAEKLRTGGSISSYYKSNGDASGTSLTAAMASETLSLAYDGALNRASSYKDGKGNTVRATQFETEHHALNLAAKSDNGLFTAKVAHEEVPHQGYVNQYMDMVGNVANSLNLGYLHNFAWGNLDTRLYWQKVEHEMGFFSSEKTGQMPMFTEGKDVGYAIKAEIPLADKHVLRIGNEYHRFTLDDWWPAVPGMMMMMGPNTYKNINDGSRDRFSVFAEWEAQWDDQWMTQLGVRGDIVNMDTGDVQPYSTMGMGNLDAPAAVVFNARDHHVRDNNIDVTALTRYTPNAGATYEWGFARKTRSPNLYERYSWGRGTMSMSMLGWYGDANAYVGDLDLKPEIANTVSATANLHSATDQQWEFKVTPYYSYVQDYIDVNQIGVFNPLMAMQVTRPKLQFANHTAEIYGVDMAGMLSLWDREDIGQGTFNSVASWTRGRHKNSDGDLYQIMPLNTRLSLEQVVHGWTNVLELQLVAKKSHVDDIRREEETGAYALFNVRTGYQWQQLRVDVGVSNLFDKYYEQPLGGVDYADWKAEGRVGQFDSVAGPGRSVDVGVTYQF